MPLDEGRECEMGWTTRRLVRDSGAIYEEDEAEPGVVGSSGDLSGHVTMGRRYV